MAKKIICDSCNGEFDSALTKCPFCGSLNVGRAEAEYMEKLEDVHDDLEALKEVPKKEVRQAVRRSGAYLKKVVIGVVAAGLLLAAVIGGFRLREKLLYNYDHRAAYLWKETNYPTMNRLYEEEKYDELVAFVKEAQTDGHSVYGWEHHEFCNVYNVIREARDLLEQEAQGRALPDISYEKLLNLEWQAKWIEFNGKLSEEEREILVSLAEPLFTDLETRWNFSEESYGEMYREMTEQKGYVSYAVIQPFVEAWYAERFGQ